MGDKEAAYLWAFGLYLVIHGEDWEEIKEGLYPHLFNRCIPLIEGGITDD